jgi:hypothetical protein
MVRMPETTRTHEATRRQLPARTAGPLSIRPATPRVEPERHEALHSSERRHPGSREALLRRITVEYQDMPGLLLTLAQAQRLFGLRDDICVRVLQALVDDAILRRDKNGSYARHRLQP